MRVHRDHGALDLRDRWPQRPAAGPCPASFVTCSTSDDVARRSTSPACAPSAPSRSPSSRLPRPGHLAQRDARRAAVLDADRISAWSSSTTARPPAASFDAGSVGQRLGQPLRPAVDASSFAPGAAPAVAAVVGDQPVAQRRSAIACSSRIDRGADRQAALVEAAPRRSGRPAGGGPPR